MLYLSNLKFVNNFTKTYNKNKNKYLLNFLLRPRRWLLSKNFFRALKFLLFKSCYFFVKNTADLLLIFFFKFLTIPFLF